AHAEEEEDGKGTDNRKKADRNVSRLHHPALTAVPPSGPDRTDLLVLRPPGGWHTAPPVDATTTLFFKALCRHRAACQATPPLARWQAGCPLGPFPRAAGQGARRRSGS